MIRSGTIRTVPFAVSADFVIWSFEQLAESAGIRLCRLLILRSHRWQMEVGSKVRGPLTDVGDHRHHVQIQTLFELVTPITIYSSRSVPQVSVIKLHLFAADAIYTVQMSRFVRASKYRQEDLRNHP